MLRIAHLSDPHLGPLPPVRWHQLAGKRLTGYLNWTRGRKQHHRMAALDAILADIRTHSPDCIALTGDLVNIALPGEFDTAAAFLARLGTPDHVMLVPGNHDVYVASARRDATRAFGRYIAGDHEPAPRRLEHAFPAVRRIGGVALIGVNSGVPKPPFMATGTLGRTQIEALGDTLSTLETEGLVRVLLIHHPPFPISRQKRLTDHEALGALLRRTGCDLVLHGHTHKGTTTLLDGPRRQIPVLGVASASAAPDGSAEPAAWSVLDIEGEPGNGGIKVRRRALSSDNQVFPLASVSFPL